MENGINQKTLRDIFSYSVQNFKEKSAFSVLDREHVSYGQAEERVNELAGLFAAAGLKKGDRVAILGHSSPNWAISFFAITTCGLVAVPLLPDFTAFEIVNILDHSGANALLLSTKLKYKIPDHISARLSLVVNLDNFGDNNALGAAAESFTAPPEPGDTAAIIYTSGTTGASKGVMLTHSNLVHQTYMSSALFPVTKDDIFLSILPLSHTYECSIGMLLPFSCGASVVYLDTPPTPMTLIPAMQLIRPTIMLSVPLIVEKIYKIKIRPVFTANIVRRWLYSIPVLRRAFHRIAGRKLLDTFGGNLRFFGIGGARIDGVTEQFLIDAGVPYAVGYGLTETSPLLSAAMPGKVKWQSAGVPLKGVQMKILNPNSEGVGEVVVKGPNVMPGYYKDEDSTAAAFTADGWFRTKDVGYMDKTGNLFIKGRNDNMITGPNGENIYPEDIESVINDFDLVLESVVVQKKGKLVAKVYLNYEEIKNELHSPGNGSSSLTQAVNKVKQDLLKHINERVNKSSRISEIVEQTVPFEKTATLKIKRYLYS